jgi:hypothetical protein
MTRDEFLALVSQDKNGCWIWAGNRMRNGYGQFTEAGRKYSAHRFSFELHGRKLSEGEFVCHRCDVRACVNPEHLFAGTPKQNIEDAVSKGRMRWQKPGFKESRARGSAHGRAKLSEDDVRLVRLLHAGGWGNQKIGDLFAVYHTAISKIISGVNWSHVA